MKFPVLFLAMFCATFFMSSAVQAQIVYTIANPDEGDEFNDDDTIPFDGSDGEAGKTVWVKLRKIHGNSNLVVQQAQITVANNGTWIHTFDPSTEPGGVWETDTDPGKLTSYQVEIHATDGTVTKVGIKIKNTGPPPPSGGGAGG